MNTPSATEFLKVAAATAGHFGFSTPETLGRDRECVECGNSLICTPLSEQTALDPYSQILATGVRAYCDNRLQARNRPTLLYKVSELRDTGETVASFHIYNVQRSIAEAILIQSTRALATDLGYIDHTVKINSLGDNESLTRYTRELVNFLRKRLDTMPVLARERMKEHALLALQELVATDHELAYRSPNPLEHLSDQSRKHFREIVEYLDMSETPYEIDSKMLANHECYSDALFALNFADTENTPITVRGGRYDELVYRLTKTRTPAVGAMVVLKNSKTPARLPKAQTTVPSVYVVHLGFGPKIRSLLLIDSLRQAGIAVHHDLASDSLSAQLRDAEARGVKYTIIIGQKEFVDNTVIVRDMAQRNQEYVPLSGLVRKLKRTAIAT